MEAWKSRSSGSSSDNELSSVWTHAKLVEGWSLLQICLNGDCGCLKEWWTSEQGGDAFLLSCPALRQLIFVALNALVRVRGELKCFSQGLDHCRMPPAWPVRCNSQFSPMPTWCNWVSQSCFLWYCTLIFCFFLAGLDASPAHSSLEEIAHQ